MIDAMNFMAKLGWKFEQAYVLPDGYSNNIRWILSKEITRDDEIKEGVVTKGEFKKNQNP